MVVIVFMFAPLNDCVCCLFGFCFDLFGFACVLFCVVIILFDCFGCFLCGFVLVPIFGVILGLVAFVWVLF